MRKNFTTIIVRHRHLVKHAEYPAFKAFIDFKYEPPVLRSVIFLAECTASKRSEIIMELFRYMKEYNTIAVLKYHSVLRNT